MTVKQTWLQSGNCLKAVTSKGFSCNTSNRPGVLERTWHKTSSRFLSRPAFLLIKSLWRSSIAAFIVLVCSPIGVCKVISCIEERGQDLSVWWNHEPLSDSASVCCIQNHLSVPFPTQAQLVMLVILHQEHHLSSLVELAWKSKWVWQGNATITHCWPTYSTFWKEIRNTTSHMISIMQLK